MAALICGVDVSSTTLDAHIGHVGKLSGQFANAPEGGAELAAFCRQHQCSLVVMEATGGYEQGPFAQLSAAGIPAAIVNPRAVRRFAEAMGLLEKTDRIDAHVISWYAEVKHIVAQQPPTPNQAKLAALVTRLHQLTELRVAQLNQRRLVSDPDVLASFQEILAVLAREVRRCEAAIAVLISNDPLWRQLSLTFRMRTLLGFVPTLRVRVNSARIAQL